MAPLFQMAMMKPIADAYEDFGVHYVTHDLLIWTQFNTYIFSF